MQPIIREFPSNRFYGGLLKDSDSLLRREKPQWIPNIPIHFFNLGTSAEKKKKDELSLFNVPECEFVCDIYGHFKRIHGSVLDIGIITPYKQQTFLLKRML